ncbi:MAG TPA: zinc-dependent metalloprotease, partial [Bdellovibrionales bacterium]|nr:zinc-dependent metalloprotease [Bdellovibrionales bacterium]
QRNSNNEETNTLLEIPETDPKKATHFKLDLNAPVIFEAIEKIDVYPAGLFDGDWYYAETVIGTAAGKEENIGAMDAYDASQRPAAKIRFEKGRTHLRGYNVNIDKRLNQSDSLNYTSALEVPVEWVDFKTEPNEKNGMAEKKVREDETPWNKRRYAKLDFEGTKTIQNDAKGSKLVDIEISDSYIGFTILRQDAGFRIKYSFLRAADRGYQAKVYPRADQKKFGFFETVEEHIADYTIHRKQDIDKRNFVNRFNPKKGKIVFHFTASSPKTLRAVGAKAIEEWDKTFQKAAGMRVELDQSQDVSLGDLRYNTINLIESIHEGGGLLGFGPSITDPLTGEIISATANVHVTPLKSNIVENLRNYIRAETGQFAPHALPQLAFASPLTKSEVAALNGQPVLKVTEGETRKIEIVKFDAPKSDIYKTARSEDFTMSIRNFAEELNQNCSAEVAELKALYKNGNVDKEVPLLESCAQKLLPRHILPTLIHELGHNFGLRHNFHASNDEANFLPANETGGRLVRTASIMDYLSFNEDAMIKPGKYDEAAIKYGYGDVPVSKLGQFKYCTDEDVIWYTVDPMCARHDAGLTPSEVVENYIRDYKASYLILNYRQDRLTNISQSRLAFYRMARYMRPMKAFYDQWRLELAQVRGMGREYLEDFANQEAFEAEFERIKTPRLVELRKAADLSYQFLSNLVFLPNRYCVGRAANGQFDAIELERLRYSIYNTTKKSIRDCSAPEVAQELATRGLKFEKEIGYSLNDMRYSMDPRDMDEPIDVVGTEQERLYAAMSLTSRGQLSMLHQNIKTYPNFLDEHKYRIDFESRLFKRIAGGLELESITAKNQFMPRFMYEQDLLLKSFEMFLSGMAVPNRVNATVQRLTPYGTYATRVADQVQRAVAVIELAGAYFAAMTEQNAATKTVIQRLKQVRALKAPPPTKAAYEAVTKFAGLLPAKAEAAKVTVEEFMAAVGDFGTLMQSAPGLSSFPSLAPVFDTVQKSKILEVLGPQLESLEGEELEKLKKMDVVELLKSGGFEYPFVKETFASLDKDINDFIAMKAQQFAFYTANRLDIDAQIDLLTKVLFTTANQ